MNQNHIDAKPVWLTTPEEFAALIVSEIDRLGKIARAAKMRVD